MKRLVMMALSVVASMAIAENATAPATTAAAPAAAPEAAKEEAKSPLSFAATLDLYSAYVWRGTVINDEPVWQPGATISYKAADYGTFAANVWSSFDTTKREGHTVAGGLGEIDYTLSYSKDVGPVSLSAGHIWYTFPKLGGKTIVDENSGKTYENYGHSTREVFVNAQYNNDIVNPFVKVNYDYALAEGFYGNVGLNKTVGLTDRLSVGSEVSLGMGDSSYSALYFRENDKALLDFNAAVFASYALTDHVSVGARLAWMQLVDQDVKHNVEDANNGLYYQDSNLLWGGINLAVSF